MDRRLTLILGGARSGKSAYAEKLALERGGAVLYVATAEAGDEEMAERITRHRAQRPSGWRTVEAPREVGPAIRGSLSTMADGPIVVLLDCLTLLASNAVAPLLEPVSIEAAQAALDAEVDGLLEAYRASAAEWIVVSNEVGMGLVPPYPLGRVYRDVLGRANTRLAIVADEVALMIAGLPWKLKG